MRKLTDEEVKHEVELITGSEWPYGVVLPVKNLYINDSVLPRTGVILRDHSTDLQVIPHVFVGVNIFAWLHESAQWTAEQMQVKGVRVDEFKSVEAMVRAGWVGD